MSEKVCYWRGSAEVREELIGSLRDSDVEVLLARNLEELLDILRRNKIATIIIDGSSGQREASDRILEITNTEILHKYPIVFISSQATKRVAVVKSRIERLLPLDVPFRVPSVLRGIRLLVDPTSEIDDQSLIEILNTPDTATVQSAPESGIEIVQSEEVLPSLGKEESSSPETQVAEPAVSEAAPPSVAPSAAAGSDPAAGAEAPKKKRKTVEDNSVRNRERLKANLDPLNLMNTYGGEVFSIATSPADFDDTKLFPDDGKQEMFRRAFAAFEKMDPWAAVHARRVTFVASAMANTLSLSKAQQQNIRLTCLFINWASTDGDSIQSRRYDLFRDSTPIARAEVAKAFRASAAMIRERLKEERTAQTVELIAQMLVGEGAMSVQQKQLITEAECVLIVELADRSCWSNGHWNPFGVYRVIRHLRDDRAVISDGGVKTAMNRVLGESVTAHITVGNIYVSNDDLETGSDRQQFKSSRSTNAPPLFVNGPRRVRSLVVQIADLLPGMRLAEPIVAVDGKTILESNTFLDQELVFQVWQLAAVRALKSKTAIQVEL